MSLRNEQYLLESSAEFNLATGAENKTDLTLTSNPDTKNSIIAATVMAGPNLLLDALVTVLTQNGDPVDYQFTNSAGLTLSRQLLPGIYQVVASAPGYLTSTPVTVNLPAASAVTVNLSLTTDPRAILNTFYGMVVDQSTGSRLGNATVILTNSLNQTEATTLTDNDGRYLLSEINNGSYTLTAAHSGYQESVPIVVAVTGSQITQTTIALVPETITTGTVQGFIKDQNNEFLAGACVGLYSVTNSTETLVQTTFTNNNGFYLFGNVPAGSYLVKAKADILI